MNPYAVENVTKMKIVLPLPRAEIWQRIATPAGLAKWLCASCEGTIERYQSMAFHWPDEDDKNFMVLEVVEGVSVEFGWFDRSKVKIMLEGDSPTILNLKVTYTRDDMGRDCQAVELGPWAFCLANLKSGLLGGPDLRTNDPKYRWRESYLD
ncbi:MAG: hypothetical protein WC712_11305 [Candidatus Brocadiia bacterium]